MPLRANVQLIFTSYTVEDAGVRMEFLSADPGPGQDSYTYVMLTDAELAGATNQTQLRNLVQSRLERKIRAATIAAKLDAFIGQTLIVT